MRKSRQYRLVERGGFISGGLGRRSRTTGASPASRRKPTAGPGKPAGSFLLPRNDRPLFDPRLTSFESGRRREHGPVREMSPDDLQADGKTIFRPARGDIGGGLACMANASAHLQGLDCAFVRFLVHI